MYGDQGWPKELDALIAAPEHHKLLFENEKVRVLDTHIPPGEITNVHTHQWPATVYYVSCSDFIRYDDHGVELVDSRKLSSNPLPGTSAWSGSLPPHALKNVGKVDLHVIRVEIKGA
ncbi:MAG: hypothetical protein IPP51_17735 [Bacteroidetes bacterium]|nr:hypothetical protein [Bacteroidota bacterium]